MQSAHIHPLFEHIHDGPRIQAVYDQVTRIESAQRLAAVNQERSKHDHDLINSAEFRMWLPKMGYRAITGIDHSIIAWQLRSYAGTGFLQSLAPLLRTTVMLPDDEFALWSPLTQTFTIADLESAIRSLDPEVFHLPTMIAWGVHKVATTSAKFMWKITDTSIERHISPWPVRDIPRTVPLTMHMGKPDKGIIAPCHAWVVDNRDDELSDEQDQDKTVATTVFLSTSGSQALMKATWANWTPRSRGLRLTHRLPQDDASRIPATTNPDASWYRTMVGESIHGIYADRRILEPTMPWFYHITGSDGIPDWQTLFDQLSRAMLIPFEKPAIERLWAVAQSQTGLIQPLISYGCTGYKVHVSDLDAWARVISFALGKHTSVQVVGDALTGVRATTDDLLDGIDETD